jgi:Na+/proline symporter
MNIWIVITSALAYLLILFCIAYYSERKAEKGESIVSNPYVYALSMAVFCTAWTFYGSVGRAATTGVGFLPVYLGPTLTAPLWLIILRKIIIISKREKITSIADFISARYGKGTSLGVLASLVALFGIVPYISIQLKAIAVSFEVLTQKSSVQLADFNTGLDTSQFIAILLGIFTIFFGARNLEATERHEGLIAAVAFESIVKLIAFISVGFFVTYFVYDGFNDVFAKAIANEKLQNLFTLEGVGIDGWEWSWLMILSMFAILLLPRQFHVNVVENTNSKHINKAMWLFPLYLLVINIFVLPIAFGGYLHFGETADADMFILNLPLHYNQNILALIVFIGGLSAATSMVIVATIALSIMISNNIVLPILLKLSPYQEEEKEDTLSVPRLLLIRRMSIVLVLFIAYAYYKAISICFGFYWINVFRCGCSICTCFDWRNLLEKSNSERSVLGFIHWLFSLGLYLAFTNFGGSWNYSR